MPPLGWYNADILLCRINEMLIISGKQVSSVWSVQCSGVFSIAAVASSSPTQCWARAGRGPSYHHVEQRAGGEQAGSRQLLQTGLVGRSLSPVSWPGLV